MRFSVRESRTESVDCGLVEIERDDSGVESRPKRGQHVEHLQND